MYFIQRATENFFLYGYFMDISNNNKGGNIGRLNKYYSFDIFMLIAAANQFSKNEQE